MLDPRLVTCDKCNKPLIQFDYGGLKLVKELKLEIADTMHSLRTVQQAINNYNVTSP